MILRELTGHTRHRRIAVDLLILQALDWDEGELLDEHSARSGGPTSEVRSTVPGLLRTTSVNCRAANRLQSTGRNSQARLRSGPSWGRETAVNNGQPRCPADSKPRSSTAVFGRDGAAGPYMACKGSPMPVTMPSSGMEPGDAGGSEG